MEFEFMTADTILPPCMPLPTAMLWTSYPTVKQTMLLQLYCTAFSVFCLPCFIAKLLFQVITDKPFYFRYCVFLCLFF